LGSGVPWDPDAVSNPNVYALCDGYYDADKIDIECDQSRSAAPSAVPSITSSPTSSSLPSISPSASSRPSISLVPSTSPSVSLIPSSSPSMDPQIISIPNTPFYVDANEKTWDECRSAAETGGFNFASIQNQQENDAVADYLQSNSIGFVWLGGYQTSYEDEPAGNWAWLEGTPWINTTYTNWYPSQPNNIEEFYLALWSGDGTWGDLHIDDKWPCIFRDPTASFAQKNAPTSEPTTSSKIAPTTVSLNIETLTSTVLTFFESIVTFFKNLLPF